LFQSRKKEEEEENLALNFYKKFMNQGPGYFGDLDEQNVALLQFEREAEDDGMLLVFILQNPLSQSTLEGWEEAYNNMLGALGLPTDQPIPPVPRETAKGQVNAASAPPPTIPVAKADGADVDMEDSAAAREAAKPAAEAAAAFIPFLTADNLMPPKLPTREEMEGVILDLRKRALVEEYFG
jgi:pre-mRNA-splicing factor ISY1